MFLSRLIASLRKKNINCFYNKKYVERLNQVISYLNQVKESKSIRLLYNNLNLGHESFDDRNLKKDLIRYIINIKFTESNTLVNVTDIEGNPKVFITSGIVGLKGKMKKYQPTAIVKILKSLISKLKFVGVSPVAIHFRGAKRYHILLVIKLLKSKIFIKNIRNYNLKAYNGCRPRKMKRLKQRGGR